MKRNGVRFVKGRRCAPRGHGWRMTVCLVLLLLMVAHAWAAPVVDLQVMRDEANPYHQRFMQGFEAALQEQPAGSRPKWGVVPEGEEPVGGALVLTVGTRAAGQMMGQAPNRRYLHALISQVVYDRLHAGLAPSERRNHSAIYIDQPLPRMAQLLRVILPEVRSAGALLGPVSRTLRPALHQALAELGVALQTVELAEGERPGRALQLLAAEAKAILLLADPVVVNPRTAGTLIQGSYLRKLPLIGYSSALVKAGALAAVHSTPEQIGWQAAAAVAEWQRRGTLPEPAHPERFSVSVNYQVARALGLELPPERQIRRRVEHREGGRE